MMKFKIYPFWFMILALWLLVLGAHITIPLKLMA